MCVGEILYEQVTRYTFSDSSDKVNWSTIHSINECYFKTVTQLVNAANDAALFMDRMCCKPLHLSPVLAQTTAPVPDQPEYAHSFPFSPVAHSTLGED